eukprot:8915110-Karenia_brevis.AAC.1
MGKKQCRNPACSGVNPHQHILVPKDAEQQAPSPTSLWSSPPASITQPAPTSKIQALPTDG